MLGSPAGQKLVKSAAELDLQVAHATASGSNSQNGAPTRPWYEQDRQTQHDEPVGGASTSGFQLSPSGCASQAGVARSRDHVKFAAACSTTVCAGDSQQAQQEQEEEGAVRSATVPAASRTGFFSFTRAKHCVDEGAASAHGQQPGQASVNGSGHSSSTKLFGAIGRANSHSAQGSQHHHVGFDVGASTKSQAASEAGSRAQSEAPSRSQSVAASGMSATLKGLLGGASSRIFGGIIGRNSGSSKSDDTTTQQEELWFTSLDDFKPICHMLHRGRYMMAYFACANKTGQHFLLKKYDKHKMLPAEERGVRRSITFSELLQHPNLVRLMGTWESDDTIFVVEEYVGKGDILNDCISHPDKYTERHVAVALAKPLLQALAHLHANNIIHRSLLPENAYMGLDDVLRLGHLTLAIDQTSDRPKSRTTLLDYMAPEMLSVQPHDEQELALLDSDDSSSSSSCGAAGSKLLEQQQQQQWPQLMQEDCVPPSQLGLLGRSEPHLTAAEPARHGSQGAEAGAALQQQSKQQVQQLQQTHAMGAHGQPQEQEQPARWMQQPAQLDTSRQTSLDLAVGEHVVGAAQAGCDAAALHMQAALDSLVLAAHHSHGAAGSGADSGRAEWEYQDHYDEKVDIWQLGCMLHELLCGSMPFELDSKLESAGLSLWADIEVLPGSVPPDCADFLQQALTKSPRLRPSAEQLLAHPWLARCQAGEPWRDPIELEAARREAELSTVTGWVRYHWAAAAAAVANVLHHWQRGGRIAPMQEWQQPTTADRPLHGGGLD